MTQRYDHKQKQDHRSNPWPVDLDFDFYFNCGIFENFWTNLDPFGPILTYVDPFGQIWTNLVPFGAF